MKKSNFSIFEENGDDHHHHVSYVLSYDESYDEAVADDLVKRFVNSIKTADPKKFERGIKKLNESNNNES